MAVLQVVRGAPEGKQFPLLIERTVMGRHPNCQVQLQNGAVSRHHAQILENHGVFHIEDLRSRNGTYVNNERIEGRQRLKDGDEIRLCDVVLTFLMYPSTAEPVVVPEGARESTEADEFDPLSSSISTEESRIFAMPAEVPVENFESSTSIRRMTSYAAQRSIVDPSVKLKAILAITQALGRELEVDSVLPKMLATLFDIFPQAEQGFVLLKDNETSRLKVKASRTRGESDADTVAVSMTVVRHALQTRQSILSQNVADDSRFKKSNALSRMRIRSMMCVPMLGPDDEGLGVIQIVTRDESHAFTEEDLDLLSSLAVQAAMAVENARLHEEHIRRRELERDLEFATQVQLGFLPKSRPNLPGYAFADYYEAALSVGGDYFDYVTLPDGRLAMAIGDVAGKGMPAALLMARLYSSTRYQLLTKPTIEDAIAGLNEEISSSGLGHRFITFLLMVIDPQQHTMTIVNAGHACPLLRTKSGDVEILGRETSSLPLGIMPDMIYQSFTVPLAEGDSVIAFTDGITEAMNHQREIFGMERLKELLAKAPDTIDQVVEKIVEEVEGFTGDINSRDDTCLIAVTRSSQ